MGMTLVEKIIAHHAGLDHLDPGQKVEVKVDRFLLRDHDFYKIVKAAIDQGLDKPPNNHQKIAVAIDQFISGKDHDPGRISLIREYSNRWYIYNLYELGKGGIENNIFPDGGLVRPGDLIVTGDGSLRCLGALGALVFPLDTEAILRALFDGMITVEVPETIRVEFKGAVKRWVGGKDLAFKAMNILEQENICGKAIEFCGEGIKGLDIPERLAFCSSAINMEVDHLLVEPDEKTRIFARARSDRFFRGCRNEDEACFKRVVECECANLDPLVVYPFRNKKICKVLSVDKQRVDQVIIGGDGNGRIEDLRKAAALLREYRAKKRVRIIVIPGSQQVLLHAMEEGLIQIFVRAGAHIGPPSHRYTDQCHFQGISKGEVCLSTSGRFYSADEIGEDKEIIYCNPEVAAVSAVLGFISDPYEMLRTVKRMPTGIIK